MNSLLAVDTVSKNFGNFTALNKVSINVPKGSIFGLLGPNGAGKTTLIRIINQITMPDTGNVMLGNEPLQAKHIREIGYMPEERGLYKSMKVGEQLLYLAQLKGLDKQEARKRAKYWFDKLEIGNWWGKKIQELSKGQAQKIQFVVTVIHQPKLLIFDEPFSGFDPINANLIKDEILLLRDQGATVIFSTHRMESVEELCDHITLIHKSNKILEGEINTIKRQYRSNTFEVGVGMEEAAFAKAEKIITEKYNAHRTTFKSLDNELQMNIKIAETQSPNVLLQDLSALGQITHFSELIPAVNDIFIKAVNESI